MKKQLPAVLAAAIVVTAVPLVVAAETGASQLERQVFRSKTQVSQTSSRAWLDLPGLSGGRGVRVCSRNLREVSANFSFVKSGAPAAFRLVVDGVPENPMEPGVILTPRGVHSSSFTFAARLADFEDNSNHHIAVQWRSRNGKETVVRRALLNVAYDEAEPEQC